MLVLTTASQLAAHRDGILVPTMGALHEGHSSLVRQARLMAGSQALPPQVEMSLLGELILDPRITEDVLAVIKSPAFFRHEAHQAIFRSLVTLHHNHQAGDLVQLVDSLREGEALNSVGGVAYLEKLARETPGVAGAKEWALQIAETFSRGVDSPAPYEKPSVLVTIFVNPTQFGPSEDFARYPRTLDEDLRACEAAGADIVFAPPVEEIYPPGNPPRTPRLPNVATVPKLEDAARPSHFAGVCQVVLRLCELIKPAAAIFGEKDWQQLQVIRAMLQQELLPIRIIPAGTVRETDGLAMSSRNRFLSREERGRAVAINESLWLARKELDPDKAEQVMREHLGRAGITPDYAVVRNAETLAPRSADQWDRSEPRWGPLRETPMRAVIAGRVGPVRLLDNAAWEPGVVGTHL